MKSPPLLQVALDETKLSTALAVAKAVAPHLQVIEAGTLLLASEGAHAVRALRQEHPDHLVLADLRIIRAGRALAEICFEAGANWISVMAEAPDETIRAAVKVADTHQGEVQLELGDTWNPEDIKRWVDLGVTQAIFHQSHEADAAAGTWTTEDLDWICAVDAAGLAVTVTGGITADDVPKFRSIPIKVFIAGRSIRKAADPAQAATEFSSAIQEVFGGLE